MELELEIFYDTEQSDTLNAIGIPVSEEMLELKYVTFYKIDSIENTLIDNKDYPTINSAGRLYVCNMEYHKIKKLISEQQRNDIHYHNK